MALGFGVAPSLWTFIPPFAIGELALFSIQARVSTMAGQHSGSPTEPSSQPCGLHLLLWAAPLGCVRVARQCPLTVPQLAHFIYALASAPSSSASITRKQTESACSARQAPSNALVLWSVPPRLRPFAMALVVVIIHLLGDVPSSPAIGRLQDAMHNWRCGAPAVRADQRRQALSAFQPPEEAETEQRLGMSAMVWPLLLVHRSACAELLQHGLPATSCCSLQPAQMDFCLGACN